MGVTQLWNILEPVKRQGDLASLKGKTLCVDLSGWICEAQGSKGLKANVLKPHLRNLFFRVWNLTRVGVKLVFVVDGDAPEVKWEAIVKRNEARRAYGECGRGRGRGRGRGVATGQRKKVGRSNFRIWVNECTTLLKLLGIPYVESAGEAEALCAWMDAKGIVDGCITNDGDAFLYGARTVYKDLCISSKECTMDSYCMDDVEDKICLNREMLVSLAILLGCDYLPQGVPGVGKEMGLKLVQALQGVNLLQRFQDWSNFEICEDDMSKIEKTVKQKASKVAGFPNQAVIDEFMCPKLKTQHLIVPKGYKCPNLKELQEFCWNYLEWPEDYTTEKILPLVTHWQMEKGVSVKHTNKGSIVTPERIVKARVQNRIECYEVLWKNDDIGDACQSTFVTIETRSLFGQVYPVLVEEFEILQDEKKSKKKVKRKAKHHSEDLPDGKGNEVEELCSNFDTLSLVVENNSVRDSTSHLKLNHGKQTVFSDDEMTETEWQSKQAGNSSHDDENIVNGSQEEPKGRDPRQSNEEEDKKQHSDGANYAQKNNLASIVQIGKKTLKCKENLKVKAEKVENLLDSTDASSEDEMSDSFFCEFVAPLAQRLEEQCFKNINSNDYKIGNQNGKRGTNVEMDIPDYVDSVDTKSIKKSNEKDNIDEGIQVVLIESSEDEEEHDVWNKSRSKENTCLKEREKLPHLERPALGGSSTRKYDAKTSKHVESDVKMTALERARLCVEIKHKKHPLEKTKADGALNGKEEKREPGIMPLDRGIVCSKDGYRSQMATGKAKDDGVRKSMEIKTEPVNNSYFERSASSLDVQCGSSAVSSSCTDRASATMVTKDQERQLHRGKKIPLNRKTKVMQRVYFSSDSSDDNDDSWYIGSGNGGGDSVAAAASVGCSVAAAASVGCSVAAAAASSDGRDDSWYLDSGYAGSVAAAVSGGGGGCSVAVTACGGGSVAAAAASGGGGGCSVAVAAYGGGGGSVASAASGGDNVAATASCGGGGSVGAAAASGGGGSVAATASGGGSVAASASGGGSVAAAAASGGGSVAAAASGDGRDDSWYLDSGCGGNDDSWFVDSGHSGIAAALSNDEDHSGGCGDEDVQETKPNNIKKQEKKESKISSTKTMKTKLPHLDNDMAIQPDNLSYLKSTVTKHAKRQQESQKKGGKISSSQLVKNMISGLSNDIIHLENGTHPKCTETNGAKHESLKMQNSKSSQLKLSQPDSDNVRQVTKLHPSTHKQDRVCISIEKTEKILTPKSLKKTEDRENESPLEDVFVPLSLSERLGRHLHGRRNVLSTLRTLSSNE